VIPQGQRKLVFLARSEVLRGRRAKYNHSVTRLGKQKNGPKDCPTGLVFYLVLIGTGQWIF